jgi:spore germination cell wall hydrolase CwlJ-like protein
MKFPTDAESWEIAARTIYGEARGQPYVGQVAVAWVIRNRAEHPKWWGLNLKDVCLRPAQFSCWNQNDANRAIITSVTADDPNFRRSLGIMALVLSGDLPDPTDGSTNYYTTSRPTWAREWPPGWASSLQETIILGAHTFLKEKA